MAPYSVHVSKRNGHLRRGRDLAGVALAILNLLCGCCTMGNSIQPNSSEFRPRARHEEYLQAGSQRGWQGIENWRRLGRGMTTGQVRSLLGDPLRVEALDFTGTTTWYFDGDSELSSRVMFDIRTERVKGWTEPPSQARHDERGQGGSQRGWQGIENWRRLGRGMTTGQVRSLLGDPLRVEALDFTGTTTWYFDADSELSSRVMFDIRTERVKGWTEP